VTDSPDSTAALAWEIIQRRTLLYAGSCVGRAVWMFVKWVEPVVGRAGTDSEPRAPSALLGALEALDRAHLGVVVRLTGGASVYADLLGDAPAEVLPAALLDAAAHTWMALAERADRERLRADGRWVRAPRREERAVLAATFTLSLQFHLAVHEAASCVQASSKVTEFEQRLEALIGPLVTTVACLPPLPLSKDFACSTFPLWDALELRWRDCHRTDTLRVRARDRDLTLTLDGVLR
jgi:hypothetical protein